MCVRTKTGYLMNDGTEIKYGASIEEINPQHIKELSELNPSTWDLFVVFHAIDGIKGDVDKRLKAHNLACPVQPSEIDKRIDNKLEHFPRKFLKNTNDIIKEWTVIIVAFLALLKAFQII